MIPNIGLLTIALHLAAGNIKVCEKCGLFMRRDISCHGSSLDRSADHGRLETGWICAPAGCGTWSDEVHVVMPEIPEPERTFHKSVAFRRGIAGRPANSEAIIRSNLTAIKFWLFNGASMRECERKLKAKGFQVGANTISKYLRLIAAETATEAA